MNRQQRRAAKSSAKEPIYNLTLSQIEGIKRDAVSEASDIAFKLLLCIPVMVIHDKYPLLMKKEVDGKGREERLADLILDLYDSFNRDYVTLQELEECLYDETGIRFEEIRKKR